MPLDQPPERQEAPGGASGGRPAGGEGATLLRRLDAGIAVAVSESLPDELLGVRDAFLRYFRRTPQVPVALVAQRVDEERLGLALSDEEAIARARRRVRSLQRRLGEAYHFYVAVEGGMDCVAVDGDERFFVRSWTVIAGLAGEAWGANGSLEIPARALEGLTTEGQTRWGTRRRGGLIHSLTGGTESRRAAVGESTFHALCSLFYGLFDGHPYAGSS